MANDDEEEELILFENSNIAWKPVESIDESYHTYLENCPINYKLFNNANKKNFHINEAEIWKKLGVVKDLDIQMKTATSIDKSSINEIENPFYKKSIDPILSIRAKRRLRKSGVGVETKWHEIPEVKELSDDAKEDIEILEKRQMLITDHKLKRNKSDFKRFQRGVTVDDPGSFFERIPKKDRRQTIVDEILQNSEIMRHHRKKYMKVERDNAVRRLQLRRIAQKRQKVANLKGNRKPLKKSVVD